MIVFFYFGINIFEEYVNEGDGCVLVVIFNFMVFDCGQWMCIFQLVGIFSVIIIVKYVDGFCFWFSKYMDYGVKNFVWKNGKGDVVCEFVDVCEEYGIKVGIYLGLYDWYEYFFFFYIMEKYKQYYGYQLEELMGDYGKVWEIWWDGVGVDELIIFVYIYWYKIV